MRFRLRFGDGTTRVLIDAPLIDTPGSLLRFGPTGRLVVAIRGEKLRPPSSPYAQPREPTLSRAPDRLGSTLTERARRDLEASDGACPRLAPFPCRLHAMTCDRHRRRPVERAFSGERPKAGYRPSQSGLMATVSRRVIENTAPARLAHAAPSRRRVRGPRFCRQFRQALSGVAPFRRLAARARV